MVHHLIIEIYWYLSIDIYLWIIHLGCAYLINHKKENKLYIAKKVHLSSLSTKEKDSSLQEVSLLKRMKHPNIVKFVDSFIDDSDVLTIVMEYCEEGDI